jgi:CRP-like cAMP-binding protein
MISSTCVYRRKSSFLAILLVSGVTIVRKIRTKRPVYYRASACGWRWKMRDISANRHGGNTVNVLAFRRGEARYANARETIYTLIAESSDGMTSKEIAQRTGWALHTFSRRLTELKDAGKIRSTRQKRYGAEVWIAYRAFPMQLLIEAA